MPSYLIGIDAGGTKTTAAAFTPQGEKRGEATGGFGNVTVDFDKGMAHICETVDRLMAECGEGCAYLCLGCAGIETGGLKPRARALLEERYGIEVCVTNDAMLALYASLRGKDGILVIAGTGSIGYLKQGRELHRFGGWGHLINDDGSGYTIAIKAIRFIAYSFDAGNGDSPLKRAVFEKLGITELKELIDFVYRSGKGEIAALVPVIDRLAEEGDPQALEIMEWAGERLAWLAVGLCRRWGEKSPRIAVSGSVLTKSPVVSAAFRRTLAVQLGQFELSDASFEPPQGGYYLWREEHS